MANLFRRKLSFLYGYKRAEDRKWEKIHDKGMYKGEEKAKKENKRERKQEKGEKWEVIMWQRKFASIAKKMRTY